jgi:hypothetical protein
MPQSGTIDFRSIGRIINLTDPIAPGEPGLSRDSVYRPTKGGRILTNEQNFTALTTVAIAANVARFSLLEVSTDVTISGMSTEVTAVAGGAHRTCIYRVNDRYYPTTLVAEGGLDQSGAVVGLKSDNIGGNKVLRAGVYAIGIRSSGAVTMRAVAIGGVSRLLGRVNVAGYTPITGFTVPYTWVAGTVWPATFPALTVTDLTNVAQVIHAIVSV